MLAEPQFVEAEPVGLERRLLVLGERVGEHASRRMHRHHEQSKAHSIPRHCERSEAIRALRPFWIALLLTLLAMTATVRSLMHLDNAAAAQGCNQLASDHRDTVDLHVERSGP